MIDLDFTKESGIEIFNCKQGTDEWFECRRGIPTASRFTAILAKGEGKTRAKYLKDLLGERMTGTLMEGYHNKTMDRGHVMEAEARQLYEFMNETAVEEIGFILNGRKGCSPDAVIDDDGMLEIKSKIPSLQIDVLLADKVPTSHIAQIQGQLFVGEREWCDFVSYWPKLPLFVKRVYRDEVYIKRLSREIDRFNNDMDELEEKIRKMY